MIFTDEQEAIINSSGDIKVNAVAGCISGDCMVRLSRAKKSFKMTLLDLYFKFNNLKKYPGRHWKSDIPTYIRSNINNTIQLNEIKNVMYSGKKETLTFYVDGNNVTCTFNHEIFTSTGWVKAKDLNINSLVAVDTLYKYKKTSQLSDVYKKQMKKRYRDKEIKCGKYYINARNISNGCGNRKPHYIVREQYIIYEAYLNNMSYDDFLKLTYSSDVVNYTHINTNTHVLHHKDGNHKNNNIDNLELLSIKEHAKFHCKGYNNFKHGIIEYKPVIKIDKHKKIIDVYDIECEQPHHNFVVNNVIVHNSGKTSTLVEYARRRPDEKILYLVFNRSAKLDAEQKFKTAGVVNVMIQTAHSLAYRKIIPIRGYRVTNDHKAFDIKNILNLGGVGYYGFIVASHISNYLELYFNSIAEEPIDVKDKYQEKLSSEQAKTFFISNDDVILQGVFEMIKRMRQGVIDVTHSFYLKEYQLSNPKLNYDCIMYDEMQDSNPVMIDIFIKQKCRKVCVGDDNQQIYGWRGAVNALSRVGFHELPLTVSFRFNQEISDMAMRCLDMKKIMNPQFKRFNICGSNQLKTKGTIAVLARTNLSLLAEAITYISSGNVGKIYFEGNINSYTFMNGVSIYDVYNLYYNNVNYIRNPLIKMMKSFKDLEDYIKKTEDNGLGMLVTIVRKYGKSIPSLFKRLKDINLPDNRKHEADIIFSTIHKSKGLEYDTVKLMDDFIKDCEIKDMVDKGNYKYDVVSEEVNVLYVAITRVKTELILSDGMKYLNG